MTQCQFEIDSPTHGVFIIIIDEDDIERVAAHNWCISKEGSGFYPLTKINGETFRLHQFLIGKQNNKVIDHINRNTLDNRKSNLRIVSLKINLQNNSAKGYSWDKRRNKFQAYIVRDYKKCHLGYFDTEASARCAYLAAREFLKTPV